jgi:hypothetical protein
MTEHNRYTVLKKATIRPNKIVFYQQFINNTVANKYSKTTYTDEEKKFLLSMGIPVRKTPEINKHNFEISKKAASRIKEKVTWLYTLAKSKTTTYADGKKNFAFKMNFITLSLPSSQRHTSNDITNVCLNQFLTECKQRYGLSNYVWRMEFQKNGNVHYHIATDCFINYWVALSIWNRCIEKLGYVLEYHKKFASMSYNEYYNRYKNSPNVTPDILLKRYQKGVSEQWSKPNTVDIKTVNNGKNIAFYISKYITKPSENRLNPVVAQRENTNTNIRLWFCSRSLSRLDKISIYLDSCNELAQTCFEGLEKIKTFVYDYTTVHYFNISEQITATKKNFWLLFNNYARCCNYIPHT